MSELPKGWTSSPLRDLSRPNRPRRNPAEYSHLPFVGMEQIEPQTRRLIGTLDAATMRSTAFHFQPGDILYGRLRPYLNKVHRAQIEGLCSSEFIVLPPGSSFEPDFLAFFLNTKAFVEFSNSLNQGDRPRVSFEQIGDYVVPLPPLDEQKRIAENLEKLLGRVEAAQERLDRIPVILKRFRQSVLAAACSGKLTADWRAGNRSNRSPDHISEDLPHTWFWTPFGEYVENHDGGRVPLESSLRKARQGEFPYYGASGVIDSIDGFTHEGEFLLIGEDGANLVARSKPIAFLAEGKIWVNNHAHVVRCKNGLPNAYLSFYVNSIDLQPYVTGSAQPKLTQANMNKIPVPVPPGDEQFEIVRRVDELFKFVDNVEERYKKAKAHTDKLTQSILAKAFRGELVPQEPDISEQSGRP